MTVLLGNMAISSGVNTSFEAVSDGFRGLIIGNESGLTVGIALESGGVSKTLYPGTVDYFPINRGFTGNVQIRPITILGNVASWPSSSLCFDAVGINEPDVSAQYPLSLARLTVGNTLTTMSQGSTLVNIGNAAPTTNIIEIQPNGDAGFTTTLDNEANLVNGDTAYPGTVKLDNNKINSDGAGNWLVQLLKLTGKKINDGSGNNLIDWFTTPGVYLKGNPANNGEFHYQGDGTHTDFTRAGEAFGTGNTVNGAVAVNHGLKVQNTATTPDIVLITDTSGTPMAVSVDTLTTTQFTIHATAAHSFSFLAIKF